MKDEIKKFLRFNSQEMRTDLDKVLSTLNPREEKILRLRFGIITRPIAQLDSKKTL
jgi:DNA-directed RNA polymerase sigma subunit (sigma70/sigma32)